MDCSRCGQTCPADFAFCPRCGAALEREQAGGRLEEPAPVLAPARPPVPRLAPAAQHDRRIITILFCDVVDSTPLAERLDPEEFLEIMNGAFELLVPAVLRHEGTVARLMGDAVLAFFGVPVAHEDDPERAVRVALDIVEHARQYGERLLRERGIDRFAVRAGINTGRVVVGSVGATAQAEYSAMGDAVNMAARMQTAAPPNGVLITHDTYRQIRGKFDVEPQQPVRVKGYSEPVQTYVVRRAKPLAFPLRDRGVEGVSTRMIGRDKELATLQRAWRRRAAASSARFTVIGDAGIGKSRLLDEFVSWVDLRPEPANYWRGRCAWATQGAPYSLLRDLFARRFGIADTDTAGVALGAISGRRWRVFSSQTRLISRDIWQGSISLPAPQWPRFSAVPRSARWPRSPSSERCAVCGAWAAGRREAARCCCACKTFTGRTMPRST